MKLTKKKIALALSLSCVFLALAKADTPNVNAAEKRLRETIGKVGDEFGQNQPNVGDDRANVSIPSDIGTVKHQVPNFTLDKNNISADPMEIAKRFTQDVSKLNNLTDDASSDLLVFVSFSMPDASLKRIAAESRKTGAVMVLRGFKNNSLNQTKEAVSELVALGGKFMIHPDLFTHYKINEVPTTVIADNKNSEQSCFNSDGEDTGTCQGYLSIKGDVSLNYVLEAMQSMVVPELSALAERKLDKLQGRN